MFKIQLTEKDESAGNDVHVKKKKKKTHLDSEIILKKDCSAVFLFLPPRPVSVK